MIHRLTTRPIRLRPAGLGGKAVAIRPLAVATFAATAALMALLAAPPADSAVRQSQRAARQTQETGPRAGGERSMAIVWIRNQRVTIYDKDGWILRAPVSSGIHGRETPAGVF